MMISAVRPDDFIPILPVGIVEFAADAFIECPRNMPGEHDRRDIIRKLNENITSSDFKIRDAVNKNSAPSSFHMVAPLSLLWPLHSPKYRVESTRRSAE